MAPFLTFAQIFALGFFLTSQYKIQQEHNKHHHQ
jgi:hypothetical protein